MSATPSRPWLATQPLKAIALVCFLLAAPPYLLVLAAKYALPSRRPSPRLGYVANLRCAGVRILLWFAARIRSPRLAAEKLPSEKNRTTAVEVPPPQDPPLYTGVLAPTRGGVQPAPRTAVWFPEAPPPLPSGSSSTADADAHAVRSETVVMHLPGGAFVVEFGNQSIGDRVARAMLANTGAARLVWAQYRLADKGGRANESGSFPGAVQDALTFYAHLLSMGYDARNVVVSGDSAGGNVVIALLRYLEATRVLPLPRGVMAWAPWVDVTARSGADYAARDQVAAGDLLNSEFLEWGVEMYRPSGAGGAHTDSEGGGAGAGGGDLDAELEAYVSPLHHPFKTSVPLFVQVGEAEAFYPAARKFAAEMEELNGSSTVRFHGTPRALHDLLLLWVEMDMRDEVDAAVKDAWELMG